MKFTIGAFRGHGRKKKMRREEKAPAPAGSEATPDGPLAAATPVTPPPPAATPPPPDDGLDFGVIEVQRGKDDGVSLISEPYFGDVNGALVGAGDTVGESVVSSQGGLYVYGLARPRADTGAESARDLNTSAGRLFGDDATLEGLYQLSPEDSPGADVPRRQFRVVAPPGKLGIVVDNPRGDVPVVHAIKETSPLHGQVMAGDLVLAVDEADCAGMSAHRLSAFLNSRSREPARTLLLARAARG